MAKATTVSPAARSAWSGTQNAAHPGSHLPVTRPLDWRKRMSDTVAYSLLVYTGLQIMVTMNAMTQGNGSTLPLFALVVLVAAIIPLFRHYERHWEQLDDAAAADPAYRARFRRDQLAVWLLGIGLPFAMTGAFKAVVSLLA